MQNVGASYLRLGRLVAPTAWLVDVSMTLECAVVFQLCSSGSLGSEPERWRSQGSDYDDGLLFRGTSK